jgi:hypothetical protein
MSFSRGINGMSLDLMVHCFRAQPGTSLALHENPSALVKWTHPEISISDHLSLAFSTVLNFCGDWGSWAILHSMIACRNLDPALISWVAELEAWKLEALGPPKGGLGHEMRN